MINSPKKLGYRMPAEYEPHHGTLMIWPTRPGSWLFQGKAAKRAFTQIIKTIAESEKVYLLVDQDYLAEAKDYLGDSVVYLDIPTNDAWARDTGPTILVNDKGKKLAVDWSFNAWGGTYDGLYQDYEADDQVASRFAEALEMPVYDAKPFVLEGGAIHSDGQGTILVTESCLLSPGRNPHLTKEEIENTLLECLGAEKLSGFLMVFIRMKPMNTLTTLLPLLVLLSLSWLGRTTKVILSMPCQKQISNS